MGKFEKLVVLTVLFAAAIILAISFNRGTNEVDASSPLSGAKEVLEREKEPTHGLPETTFTPPKSDGQVNPASGDGAAAGLHQSSKPGSASLLLNAGEDMKEPAAQAPGAALSLEPTSDPNHRILTDTVGLRPSFMSDLMVYTTAEGDTWSSLAQRFYRDGRFTRNLHQANESLGDLAPGTDIFVPVFDVYEHDAALHGGTSELAGDTPAANGVALATAGTLDPANAKPSEAAPMGAGQLVYEVKPGDTLSEISLAVFGNAGRWKELLDANKDVLAKPEGLQVGMKLKIPPGGKLPGAPAAKTDTKKVDPKAKTAQAPPKKADPKADPKKKKVL